MTKIYKGFRTATTGSVAVIFAIAAVPILGVMALAIGYSKFNAARASVTNILDAAAIDGAKTLMLGTEADAIATARRTFSANARGLDRSIMWSNLSVTASKTSGIVEARANVAVNVLMGNFLGGSLLSGELVARAQSGVGGLPLEIGVMLDVSGSMAGARFDALKTGVRDLLGELIGVGKVSNSVRIGFSPFSSSVNAGPYASTLVGGSSALGCVGDRRGVNAFTDAPPAGDFTNVDGTFVISNDENGGVYRTGSFKGYGGTAPFDVSTVCPRATLTPITGDYNVLNNALTAFQAEGITAGHLGMAFAWYLVSPKWTSIWPAGRQPKPLGQSKKFIVLMSDGEFNTYYVPGTGRLPNEQGRKLCDAMKSAGITIFAISYDFNGGSEELFRQCVSRPEYMFTPDTTSALTESFRTIAKELKPLIPLALTK